MFSVALLPLAVAIATPAPSAATHVAADDPAVRVSLDQQTYVRGEQARVTVHVRDNGYLVILQLDPDGLVRVLFPIDPGDSDFVRGDQSYAVQDRGGRDGFLVGSTLGSGTVYAAWSAYPFQFQDFSSDGHWNYNVIMDSALPRDPETGFTSIVQRMSTGHFDYDLESYTVQQQVAVQRTTYVPMYYPTGYGYGGCYWDWYDCGTFYGPGYGFGVSVVFGQPWWYNPYSYGYGYFPFGYYPYSYGYWGRSYYGPVIYRYPRRYAYWPGRRYEWKGGAFGGGAVGVGYRPRGESFASTGVSYRTRGVGSFGSDHSRSPLWSSSRFARRPGATPVSWRPRDGARSGSAAGRASRPRQGVTRRAPDRMPDNAPRIGRRVPRGVELLNQPGRGASRRGTNAPSRGERVPMRPRSAPPTRVSAPARSAPPTRVARPRSAGTAQSSPRRYAPPTRVERPRQAPTRVARPRQYQAPTRVERPRQYQAPTRVERPRQYQAPTRVERPRQYQAPTRVERPQYRAPRAQPRYSPPPRSYSAPRHYSPPPRSFSAPRSSAPRSQPRRGGGGGRRHH